MECKKFIKVLVHGKKWCGKSIVETANFVSKQRSWSGYYLKFNFVGWNLWGLKTNWTQITKARRFYDFIVVFPDLDKARRCFGFAKNRHWVDMLDIWIVAKICCVNKIAWTFSTTQTCNPLVLLYAWYP